MKFLSERDTREKLTAEYAIMSQLADEIKRQIDLLSTAINEVAITKIALKELEKLSGGEEILVPIGSGVMVRALFKKLDKVLVRVGDNVIIEKTPEKALEYLEEQEKTLRETLERRNVEYQNVIGRLTELEKALRGSR